MVHRVDRTAGIDLGYSLWQTWTQVSPILWGLPAQPSKLQHLLFNIIRKLIMLNWNGETTSKPLFFFFCFSFCWCLTHSWEWHVSLLIRERWIVKAVSLTKSQAHCQKMLIRFIPVKCYGGLGSGWIKVSSKKLMFFIIAFLFFNFLTWADI